MISSLAWIPRGAARAKPVRFELSPEEIARIQNLANEEAEIEKELQGDKAAAEESDADSDAEGEAEGENEGENEGEEEEEQVQQEAVEEDDTPLPPELRMDEYDDEEDMPNPLEDVDDMDDEMDMEIFGSDNAALAYEPNTHEDDAEDEEDDAILPSDSLLVLAITEDEQSHLEVQVFSQESALYVHHDILLPDFPLCVAWMDIPPYVSGEGEQKTVGNYLAVGTFSPAIEIWNLDVLDPIEPSATLGGEDAEAMAKLNKKKKKKKTKKSAAQEKSTIYLPGSHTEAVMSLSWNTVYRQLLASGSADHTVKLWDVTTQQCSYTFTHHSDKVQAVQWHAQEGWLLATGAFDKRVCLVDGRSSAVATAATLSSDIESLTWDPFQPYHLYTSLENGHVACIDIRRVSNNAQHGHNITDQNVLFSFQAHHKTTSSLHFSPRVQGMLATASLDKTVKVWDLREAHSATGPVVPKCVAYKTMNVGKLMTVRYSPDDPFLLATGGDKGVVAVWESDELDVIRTHFESAVVDKPSAYSVLTQEGAVAAETSHSQEQQQQSFTQAVQIVSAPPEDDSWMDDNTGIATSGNAEKKKKKKKASK